MNEQQTVYQTTAVWSEQLVMSYQSTGGHINKLYHINSRCQSNCWFTSVKQLVDMNIRLYVNEPSNGLDDVQRAGVDQLAAECI